MRRPSCARFQAGFRPTAFSTAPGGAGFASRAHATPGNAIFPVDSADTSPSLLVAAGGESSDASALRKHAAEDRDAAVASRISRAHSAADFGDGEGSSAAPAAATNSRGYRRSNSATAAPR